MAVQRERKIPNPLAQPLIVLESVTDISEMMDLAKKASADEGRTERDKYKFIRINAFLAALKANAEARLGSQAEKLK